MSSSNSAGSCWSLSGVLKFILLLIVIVASTSYISSINSPTSSSFELIGDVHCGEVEVDPIQSIGLNENMEVLAYENEKEAVDELVSKNESVFEGTPIADSVSFYAIGDGVKGVFKSFNNGSHETDYDDDNVWFKPKQETIAPNEDKAAFKATATVVSVLVSAIGCFMLKALHFKRSRIDGKDNSPLAVKPCIIMKESCLTPSNKREYKQWHKELLNSKTMIEPHEEQDPKAKGRSGAPSVRLLGMFVVSSSMKSRGMKRRSEVSNRGTRRSRNRALLTSESAHTSFPIVNCDKYEEIYEEDHGCWNLRGMLEFALLLMVLVASTSYISSMNSPTSNSELSGDVHSGEVEGPEMSKGNLIENGQNENMVIEGYVEEKEAIDELVHVVDFENEKTFGMQDAIEEDEDNILIKQLEPEIIALSQDRSVFGATVIVVSVSWSSMKSPTSTSPMFQAIDELVVHGIELKHEETLGVQDAMEEDNGPEIESIEEEILSNSDDENEEENGIEIESLEEDNGLGIESLEEETLGNFDDENEEDDYNILIEQLEQETISLNKEESVFEGTGIEVSVSFSSLKSPTSTITNIRDDRLHMIGDYYVKVVAKRFNNESHETDIQEILHNLDDDNIWFKPKQETLASNKAEAVFQATAIVISVLVSAIGCWMLKALRFKRSRIDRNDNSPPVVKPCIEPLVMKRSSLIPANEGEYKQQHEGLSDSKNMIEPHEEQDPNAKSQSGAPSVKLLSEFAASEVSSSLRSHDSKSRITRSCRVRNRAIPLSSRTPSTDVGLQPTFSSISAAMSSSTSYHRTCTPPFKFLFEKDLLLFSTLQQGKKEEGSGNNNVAPATRRSTRIRTRATKPPLIN